MEKTFKKFFISNITFIISSILAIALAFIASFYNIYSKDYVLCFYFAILAITIVGVYYSYKKHEKNIMKALVGSIIMSALFIAIYFTCIEVNQDLNNYVILSDVGLILLMVLFILNHYAINSDHHSNPYNIFINQILFFFIVIISIAIIILQFVFTPTNAWTSLLAFSSILFTFLTITCIESKLDAFREIREEKNN